MASSGASSTTSARSPRAAPTSPSVKGCRTPAGYRRVRRTRPADVRQASGEASAGLLCSVAPCSMGIVALADMGICAGIMSLRPAESYDAWPLAWKSRYACLPLPRPSPLLKRDLHHLDALDQEAQAPVDLSRSALHGVIDLGHIGARNNIEGRHGGFSWWGRELGSGAMIPQPAGRCQLC